MTFRLFDDEPGEAGDIDHEGQAVFDELANVFFDLPEGELDELGGNGTDFRDGLKGGFFLSNGIVVGSDPVMESFEQDGMAWAVGGDAHELAAG